MKINIIAKMMLVGALGFVIGLGIKFVWESTAFQPYSWSSKLPPIIVNCYGKDFSESQMIRAIDYWTLRGHHIGFYEHNPPDSVCNNEDEYLTGFIILKKAKRFDHDSGSLAWTQRWTSVFEMKGAVITYRPGTQNLAWINEHELGHALGYSHYAVEGHIMHPLYHKMSGKFWVP